MIIHRKLSCCIYFWTQLDKLNLSTSSRWSKIAIWCFLNICVLWGGIIILFLFHKLILWLSVLNLILSHNFRVFQFLKFCKSIHAGVEKKVHFGRVIFSKITFPYLFRYLWLRFTTNTDYLREYWKYVRGYDKT